MTGRSLVLFLLLLGWVPAGAADRPNVIFFLSDDHRSDFLSCAGHPIVKTPNIDKLASQGVRFSNAFVTTSICAASRATLLTGTWERTHGFTFGTPPIPGVLSDTSYPAVMRANGYRTGFVGKFGVKVVKGAVEKMFDEYKPLGRNPYHKKRKDGTTRHVSEIAGDHAIEFLRNRPDKNQPFCLSVSFNAPHAEDSDKKNHYPWPKAVDGLYDDVDIPAPALADDALLEAQPDFLKNSLNRVRWFWRWDTPEKYRKNVRAYYRMISGVDHVIGRVMAELEKLDLSGNTVIIFSGDNGYYRGDRNFAGKWSHYEESLRVPLVIFDPSLETGKRGKVVDAMALNVDIPATVLAASNLKLPSAWQGQSLLSLVHGAPVPADWRQDFFCEHLFNHRQIPKWEGVRGERYVYARYFEQAPPYEFLHDLQSDPQQRKNFAGDPEKAGVLAEMRKRCDALRVEYEAANPVRP